MDFDLKDMVTNQNYIIYDPSRDTGIEIIDMAKTLNNNYVVSATKSIMGEKFPFYCFINNEFKFLIMANIDEFYSIKKRNQTQSMTLKEIWRIKSFISEAKEVREFNSKLLEFSTAKKVEEGSCLYSYLEKKVLKEIEDTGKFLYDSWINVDFDLSTKEYDILTVVVGGGEEWYHDFGLTWVENDINRFYKVSINKAPVCANYKFKFYIKKAAINGSLGE